MSTARALQLALVTTTSPDPYYAQQNVTLEQCGTTALRWLKNNCRCGVGAFDGGWGAAGRLQPCTVCGTTVLGWETYWSVASDVVFVLFLVPFFWSWMRIIRLCRALGWPGLQAAVNLQALTHFFCLVAATLRLLSVIIEKQATEHVLCQRLGEDGNVYYGQLTFMVYSFFYPAAASLILCMCYYWQLHLNTFQEETTSDTSLPSHLLNALNESSANWQWVGPIRVASFLFALELCHDILALASPSKLLDTVFNMWGAIVVFLAAVFSLVTALKLHAALCESAPYNATGAIFKKLKAGPTSIVVFASIMLALVLLEILHNQWYAWLHLIDWVIARTIEAVMLTVCLATIGYVQQPQQSSALSFQENSSQRTVGASGHHAELGPLAFAPPMDRNFRSSGA